MAKKPPPRTGPTLRQWNAFEMDDRARERAIRSLEQYADGQRSEPDAPGGKPRTKAEKRKAQRQEAHIPLAPGQLVRSAELNVGHESLIDPTTVDPVSGLRSAEPNWSVGRSPTLRQFSAFEMDDDARRRAAQALQKYVADQRSEPVRPEGGKPRTKAKKRRLAQKPL